MERAQIIKRLIEEKGYTIRSFSDKCNIPYTTLYGIIKNGVGKASVNNVITICRNLDITYDELETMALGGTSYVQPTFEDAELLIARNGKNFSMDEKLKLIKLLSEIE